MNSVIFIMRLLTPSAAVRPDLVPLAVFVQIIASFTFICFYCEACKCTELISLVGRKRFQIKVEVGDDFHLSWKCVFKVVQKFKCSEMLTHAEQT